MGFTRRPVLVAVPAAVLVTVAVIVGVVLLSGDDNEVSGNGESTANCADALTVADGVADVREADTGEEDERLEQPSADLIEFGVRGEKDGICVRWTTAAPVPDGTVLRFSATSPFVDNGGGTQASSYSFAVEVHAGGARVVRPPQTSDETQPIELDAEVTHSGATVSAFVPGSEFKTDRFPYDRFSFRSALGFEPGGIPQYADSVPDSAGPLGYDGGRLCPAPCGDLLLDERGEQPAGAVPPVETRAKAVAVANEVCRRADRRLERLDRPRTVREIVRYADRAWPIFRAAAAHLRRSEAVLESLSPFFTFVEDMPMHLESIVGFSAPLDRVAVRQFAANVDEAAQAMQLEADRLGIARCEDMTLPPLVLRLPSVPPGDEASPLGEPA